MRKAYHQEVYGGRGLRKQLTECNYSYIQLGLMDFNARFYSPRLGRFIQPDNIIPNPANSQSCNRYSYSYNNPIYFVDPTGHLPTGENDDTICLPGSDCYPDAKPWGGGESSDLDVLNSELTREELDSIMDSLPENYHTVTYGKGTTILYENLKEACHLVTPGAWWCSSGNRFTLGDFLVYSLTIEMSTFNTNDDWGVAIKSGAFNTIRDNINNRGGGNLVTGVFMYIATRKSIQNRIDIKNGWRGDLDPEKSKRFTDLLGAMNPSLINVAPGGNELYDYANLSWFEQNYSEKTVYAIKNGVLTVRYHTNFWVGDALIIRTFFEQQAIDAYEKGHR
jgi:RHS repeat-associated protein